MPASRFDPRLVRRQRRVVMAVLVLFASACSAGRSSTSADSLRATGHRGSRVARAHDPTGGAYDRCRSYLGG
jgi:hypothetical protein